MILAVSQGFVRLKFDHRTITIDGEAYLPSEGREQFFAVYSKSMSCWDPPYEKVKVTDAERIEVVKLLEKCGVERGMNFDIV